MSGTYALTRDDIAAMRKADNVFFHGYRGESYLIAELRDSVSEQRIYTATEQRLFPSVRDYSSERYRKILTTAAITDYGRPATMVDDTAEYSAFASYVPEYVWETIVAAMRPGDSLVLHWYAGNDSPVLNAAGFHRDELRLRIVKGDGTRRGEYLAAHSVGPDNSARMVRRTVREYRIV